MSSSIDITDLLKRLRSWTGFERGSKITAQEAADTIEALLKDAARYRWLRENDWDSPIVKLGYDEYDNLKGAELDAAVDALIDCNQTKEK